MFQYSSDVGYAWKPDYNFLIMHCGIGNLKTLKKAASKRLTAIDLKVKQRDFEHLLFNKANSEKILQFGDFMNGLKE